MSTPPPPPPPSSPPPPAGDFGGYGEFDRPAGLAPVAPGGRTVPSAWKRIGARLLDGLIVNMIIGFFVVRSIAGDGAGTVAATGDADASKLLLATVLVLAISFVWDAVATRFFGGTPMKRVFHMRVVQAGSGAPVEWRHAVIRWGTVAIWSIIPIVSIIVPLILVITSLVFLFTKPLRQAVWDLAAKTVVVDG